MLLIGIFPNRAGCNLLQCRASKMLLFSNDNAFLDCGSRCSIHNYSLNYSPTTYFEGSLQFQQNWLIEEDFTRFQTQTAYFGFCELNTLSWPTSSYEKTSVGQKNHSSSVPCKNLGLLPSSKRDIMLSMLRSPSAILLSPPDRSCFNDTSTERAFAKYG